MALCVCVCVYVCVCVCRVQARRRVRVNVNVTVATQETCASHVTQNITMTMMMKAILLRLRHWNVKVSICSCGRQL